MTGIVSLTQQWDKTPSNTVSEAILMQLQLSPPENATITVLKVLSEFIFFTMMTLRMEKKGKRAFHCIIILL